MDHPHHTGSIPGLLWVYSVIELASGRVRGLGLCNAAGSKVLRDFVDECSSARKLLLSWLRLIELDSIGNELNLKSVLCKGMCVSVFCVVVCCLISIEGFLAWVSFWLGVGSVKNSMGDDEENFPTLWSQTYEIIRRWYQKRGGHRLSIYNILMSNMRQCKVALLLRFQLVTCWSYHLRMSSNIILGMLSGLRICLIKSTLMMFLTKMCFLSAAIDFGLLKMLKVMPWKHFSL